MTDQEIAGLGGAFSSYLGRYRGCFLQGRTARHFDNYCRGLLSDLPRKSVEPIALAAGTAVRTLQEFLTTAAWDFAAVRDLHQRRVARGPAEGPAAAAGTPGGVGEAGSGEKGGEKPG